jgi:multiple sugar transport system substrate-binding protein
MTSGSWVWAISATSHHPHEAAQLLDFLLSTNEVLATSTASGGPPGTLSAAARSTSYRHGGPLTLFGEALAHDCGTPDEVGCVATVRPPTPAYPVITNAFQEAVQDVFAGAKAGPALRQAAEVIDRDATSNNGYGLGGG